MLAERVAAALDSENVKPVSWSTYVTARASRASGSGAGLPAARGLVSICDLLSKLMSYQDPQVWLFQEMHAL
jgi:hypothetical protein